MMPCNRMGWNRNSEAIPTLSIVCVRITIYSRVGLHISGLVCLWISLEQKHACLINRVFVVGGSAPRSTR